MQYWDYAFSLLFTLIPLCSFKGTSGLTIYQTTSITAIEGNTVIMNCTLSEESVGPVRWYKWNNHQQQLLYSPVESNKSDKRVGRTVKEGPTRETDHSIQFTAIRLEDAGVYYCVKFKSDKVTVAANGSGTHLYVNNNTGPRIYQTPPSITVREGDTAIMKCTVLEESLGPVRWYKRGNQQLQLLYSQSEGEKSDPRVNRTVTEGLVRHTDQSITFSRIHLEDAGVYYCVKFKSDKVTVAANGSGTHLYVNKPSPPLVSGPKDRVDINSSVVISCVSTGFYPKEINLTWWKIDEELHGFKADIQPYGADKTYQVQSSITVRAEIDSYVTCKINHTSLDQPINSTFKINYILKEFRFTPTIGNIIRGTFVVCVPLVIIHLCRKETKGTADTQNGLVALIVETEQERYVTSTLEE